MDTSSSQNVYRPSPPQQSLFSNKTFIIIVLVILLFLSLTSTIFDNLVPIFSDLLSMIGFTTGNIIKGSADVVANTADLGIDIAKGTTHSIGDLFISNANPGIDSSKQVSLMDIIQFPRFPSSTSSPSNTSPVPVQSSEPTVTPISTQKPKAGWCYIGDFAGARGCVEVSEHDKCMSGQVFPNQAECLNPK